MRFESKVWPKLAPTASICSKVLPKYRHLAPLSSKQTLDGKKTCLYLQKSHKMLKPECIPECIQNSSKLILSSIQHLALGLALSVCQLIFEYCSIHSKNRTLQSGKNNIVLPMKSKYRPLSDVRLILSRPTYVSE